MDDLISYFMVKPSVTLFVGEKNFVQKNADTKTGYKRHYESSFVESLKRDVDLKIKFLYPIKGKKYSAVLHLANHFLHPLKYLGEFRKDRIKHIMFAEEAFMLNFLPCRKTVVSCLDVIPLVLPNEVSGKYLAFLKKAYKGMSKANAIIANSEYTKNDIVKYLGIDGKRIFVAYPPVNEIFREVKILEKFYKKFNLNKGRKYLLYVGALDLPRKNIKTILDAFSIIEKDRDDIELILVGYTTLKGGMDELFRHKIRLSKKVHIIQNITDEELVQFYNLASVFLFPTLYEGFGLPPLEAMACGTPVIASHVSSLPEVLGDAAAYTDPLNSEAIAEKALHIINDIKLRELYVAKGFEQAKKYNRKNYCEATLKVYKSLTH